MPQRAKLLNLSLDEYIERRGLYVQRSGFYRRSFHSSSSHWRLHQERVHRVQQERLRRLRLEKEVQDLDRMQELCGRLKKKLRRDASEMRQLHKRLLKKCLDRMHELRKMEKQQQRRHEFKQRFLAARRLQKRNMATKNLKQNEPIGEDQKVNPEDLSTFDPELNDGMNASVARLEESNESNDLLMPLNDHNYQLLVSLGIKTPKSDQPNDDLELSLTVEDPSMWQLPSHMEKNLFLDDEEVDN